MTTRSSLRSLRIAATLTALVGLLAVSAAPVLGKEGMEAQLTTPVRLDTPPGTALTVAWTILVEGEDGRVPVTGMPVFLRFVPPGSGAAVEAIGNERPADSGHFTATLVVPAGGIARVEVGIHNTSCVSGSCTEGDMLFDLTDDSLVSGAPTGARADAAVPMASAAYTPVQPASAPLASTSQADATGLPIPLVGLGVALAAIAALGIGLVIRSRRARHVASTTIVALGLGLMISMAIVASASAKEPAVATLDAGVPTDAATGTAVVVGWTMTVRTPDGIGPYQADSMRLRVVARDGKTSIVDASLDYGGHYIASVIVPATGIGALKAQLPSDGATPLTFDLWTDSPLAQQAAGDPAAVVPAAASPVAAPVVPGGARSTATNADPGPVLVLGGAILLVAACGAGLWLAARGRPSATGREAAGG